MVALAPGQKVGRRLRKRRRKVWFLSAAYRISGIVKYINKINSDYFWWLYSVKILILKLNLNLNGR